MGIGHISASHYMDDNSPFASFSDCGLLDTRPDGELWISDAAATATAIATGNSVERGILSENLDKKNLPTILEIAKGRRKSTGVIATTSLTYAIPAAFMVHTENWGKEYEIARQIYDSETDVLFGGGLRFFEENAVTNSNLIHQMEAKGYTFISQQNQLEVLDPLKTGKVIGLFAAEALRQANHRSLSLKMMTAKATEILNNNNHGFVLVVDGSQIDWRAHEKDDDGLLAEMRDFTSAIQWALDYQTKHPELLIVVAGSNESGGVFLDYDDRKNGGIGIKFITGNHTANFCPVFANGPRSDEINRIMTNAQLGQLLIDIIED